MEKYSRQLLSEKHGEPFAKLIDSIENELLILSEQYPGMDLREFYLWSDIKGYPSFGISSDLTDPILISKIEFILKSEVDKSLRGL